MRLITHNMLKCNIKGVNNGYPLKINPVKVDVVPAEFSAEITLKLADRVNWSALRSACTDINYADFSTIADFSSNSQVDENVLKIFHHALFELHVIEGEMICPESGRKFPIKEGIPNMLLHEDELG